MKPTIQRIICDGDSLTVGLGASNKDATYPAVLRKLSSVDVRAFGVGGERIDQVDARGEAVDKLYDPAVPDALVVMAGANDIAQKGSVETMVNSFVAYWTHRRDAAPKRLMVATTVTPIDLSVDNGNPKTFNQTAAGFNEWLRKTFATHVDLLADVAADPRMSDAADRRYFQPDGVHFTDAGNTVVAEIVYHTTFDDPKSIPPPSR